MTQSPDPEMVILAGGFGTRLSTVVSNVPKPLAPVNGRPFLEILFDSWQKAGIRKFTLLLHHRAELLIDFAIAYRDKCVTPIIIRWVIEQVPLGTGGSVANAVRELGMDSDFLVANADTWLSHGVRELRETYSPTIAVVKLENAERYGRVEIQDGRVTGFLEKSAARGSSWVNAGLYRLNPSLFQDWNNQPYSLETELFPILVAEQKLRSLAITDAEFIDIGIPEDYKKFVEFSRTMGSEK